MDNNAWKRRREPTEADLAIAAATADRIRLALEELRHADHITPEATRGVIEGLGLPPRTIMVTALRPPLGADPATTPPGADIGIRVAPTACVIGSVRPSRVDIDVAGPAAEFGCLEPFSH
ncbi:hypothetical protein [Intrasporangium sp.]|uniref:hypothetical protein n=1 Tax=Intrasporangium sp. TaxID=1925024 RepID=UPI003365A978